MVLLPIRLVLDVIVLICRYLVWVLLRVCWLLELCIDYLRYEQPIVRRPRRVYAPRTQNPMNTVGVAMTEKELEIKRMMETLGTKDRQAAIDVINRSERVRI